MRGRAAAGGYASARIISNPNKYDDWIPKDERFDDGAFLSVEGGRYQPNAWGLYDMHGNVWEWTLGERKGRKICRGGSWYDRPKRCTSSFRLDYQPYHKVFNVGFRVVYEQLPGTAAVARD